MVRSDRFSYAQEIFFESAQESRQPVYWGRIDARRFLHNELVTVLLLFDDMRQPLFDDTLQILIIYMRDIPLFYLAHI